MSTSAELARLDAELLEDSAAIAAMKEKLRAKRERRDTLAARLEIVRKYNLSSPAEQRAFAEMIGPEGMKSLAEYGARAKAAAETSEAKPE